MTKEKNSKSNNNINAVKQSIAKEHPEFVSADKKSFDMAGYMRSRGFIK